MDRVIVGAVSAWVLALVTVEVLALIIGIIGCVTGSIALWKAISALRALSTYEETQHERIQSIQAQTDSIEEKLPN